MEAKCANVQSKLDEIHMNEELLATREAQLAAAKKQKAAMEAEQEARKKEEEAKVLLLLGALISASGIGAACGTATAPVWQSRHIKTLVFKKEHLSVITMPL